MREYTYIHKLFRGFTLKPQEILETNMNGEDNSSYNDSVSCIIHRELMAEMPCDKDTKDNDRDDDQQ